MILLRLQHLIGLIAIVLITWFPGSEATGSGMDVLMMNGYTPLHGAMLNGDVEAFMIFIDHGADPNIPARFESRTPLIDAVLLDNRTMRVKFVTLLLAAGADPTIPDSSGDTPLSLVAGDRQPGIRYTRTHKNPELHKLMLAALAGTAQPLPGVPATPDPVTVCLEPGDTRFSDLALRHLGNRARWPEMVRLNGLKAGESVTVGDCFLLPPR